MSRIQIRKGDSLPDSSDGKEGAKETPELRIAPYEDPLREAETGLGKRGALSNEEAFQNELRRLSGNKRLIIDPSGRPIDKREWVSSDKQACFRHHSDPENGIGATKLEVRDGLASRNSTYLTVAKQDASSGEVSTEQVEIKSGAIIGVGENTPQYLIECAGVSIGIPPRNQHDNLLDMDPIDAQATVNEMRISLLPEGKKFELGRAANAVDLPLDKSSVSRFQLTIERLENVQVDDESIKRYRITDGKRSDEGTFVEDGDGWRELHSWQEVVPGMRLKLGRSDDAEIIQIPEQEEHLQSYQEAPGIFGFEVSIGPGTERNHVSEHSVYRMDSMSVSISQDVGNINVHNLGVHLRNAGRHIRAGEYDAAIQLLEDDRIIENLGYTYAEGNVFELRELSEEGVRKTITDIACNSWFMIPSKMVSPAYGFIPEDLYDPDTATPEERELADNFKRELCLIYLEEFVHAYQDCIGMGVGNERFSMSGNVSQKGILIEPPKYGGVWSYRMSAHEIDVAQFMIEDRVPLSEMYLDRYDRNLYIDLLKGFQSSVQQQAIFYSLSILQFGESAVIGRSPEADIFIDEPDAEVFLEERKRVRPYAEKSNSEERFPVNDYLQKEYEGLSRQHATVTRLPNGNYKVVDGTEEKQTKNGIYTTDRHGKWYQVKGEAELAPGTAVRLGKRFQFYLP